MISGLPADVPGFADAVARLRAAGVGNPRLDVRVLWDHAARMGEDAPARFKTFLARRALREPVAYIVGSKEFWGLDFAVGPGVLVPRPDSETVVEAVRAAFSGQGEGLRVLDLGTGSGCLLAAILHELPGATGVGVDASMVARRYAADNLERLGLAARSEIRAENWCDGVAGRYDIVVSNPPYIPTDDIAGLEPDVAEFEPASALDGGVDGYAAYRTLFARVPAWLNPGGQAFFEIGQGQHDDLIPLAAGSGLSLIRMVPDLSGTMRVLVFERP